MQEAVIRRCSVKKYVLKDFAKKSQKNILAGVSLYNKVEG